MDKTKRNRAATMERIMNALEEVLTERGFEGVSIPEIAQKAAVSKVLIYRYFNSLEGLLAHYVKLGRLVPHYTPAWLTQIQPEHTRDLAPLWSSQAIQLFRQFRASRPGRELLKATVQENNPVADAVSQAQDDELTQLVEQLSFVDGADYQATSAVVLGALSYFTIQAQLDRSVIGIDLRSETGWRRIEEAVKIIYNALNRAAVDSPLTHVVTKEANVALSAW